MNKDSDDGFIYCNDDMQTVSPRPDRQSFAPTLFQAKVSLTFSTIRVLESEASVTVHRLYALSAGVGWST